MTRTVVFCGQQGIGKSVAMFLLAEKMGCEHIVDAWNGIDALPAGTLAVTNNRWHVLPPGAIGVHVNDADGMNDLLDRLGLCQEHQARPVRPPYSDSSIACRGDAQSKDDCICIRAAMRSKIASATSGEALSSNTASVDNQAISSVSVTNTAASRTDDGIDLLASK